MSGYPTLAHPPIREALIDIRVRANKSLDVNRLKDLDPRFSAAFPKRIDQRTGEAQVQFRPEAGFIARTFDLGLSGWFFKAEDEREIVQFRVDGFTFNRLAPYTKWDEVFPKAMELWQEYVRLAQPEAADRLAVRYINGMKLEGTNIDDYLTVGPPLPDDLPVAMTGFLTHVTIREPQEELFANITQSLDVDLSTATVILDIDCFAIRSCEPLSESLPATFERLREFKNKIFFSSISSSALARFK